MSKFRLEWYPVGGGKFRQFDSPPKLYEADDVYERIRQCSFRADSHIVTITRIEEGGGETRLYEKASSTIDVLVWLDAHDLEEPVDEMDALMSEIAHLP